LPRTDCMARWRWTSPWVSNLWTDTLLECSARFDPGAEDLIDGRLDRRRWPCSLRSGWCDWRRHRSGPIGSRPESAWPRGRDRWTEVRRPRVDRPTRRAARRFSMLCLLNEPLTRVPTAVLSSAYRSRSSLKPVRKIRVIRKIRVPPASNQCSGEYCELCEFHGQVLKVEQEFDGRSRTRRSGSPQRSREWTRPTSLPWGRDGLGSPRETWGHGVFGTSMPITHMRYGDPQFIVEYAAILSACRRRL
jgi:hypothetical protein